MNQRAEAHRVTGERVLVVGGAPQTRQSLAESILQPAGYDVLAAADVAEGMILARELLPDVILACHSPDHPTGVELLEALQAAPVDAPVILVAVEGSEALAVRALRLGAHDYLAGPYESGDLLDTLARALRRYWVKRIRANVPAQLLHANHQLEQRLRELNTLVAIGKRITSRLDLQTVLTRVVEAAVALAQAEEGTLMLVDQATGDLYSYAATGTIRRVDGSFRLPVADSLAGQVVKTGQPLVITGEDLRKIKTHYYFRDVAYVPLAFQETVIGVLGVSNREKSAAFNPHTLQLLSVLADFAAIAIENARLYDATAQERNTLNAILRDTEAAIVVVDTRDAILFANPIACQSFDIDPKTAQGRPLTDTITHPQVLDLFAKDARGERNRSSEIALDDGDRVLSARLTAIDDVGRVLITQDITHLKELDRAKTDFVTAVSHDLRSPLTAILGYVELLNRAGPLNEGQQQFVERIVFSVQSITALINDLLELGRIEAGFDQNYEPVAMNLVVRYAVEGMRHQWESKHHELQVTVPDALPPVAGNALRLRQMINNLLENAIKYTPDGGQIRLKLGTQSQFVLLTVSDTGIGIPPQDQPYVFDKFYRTDEAIDHFAGTGLGLAIVKGIVDQHKGRIWMDSQPGQGTTFTVMLPADAAKKREAKRPDSRESC
jgi:two-component system NtrC family sensor kinase